MGMWQIGVIVLYSFLAGFFFNSLLLGRHLERKLSATGSVGGLQVYLWVFLVALVWPVGIPVTTVRSMKRFRRFQEMELNKLLLSEMEKKRREHSGGK